MPSSARTPSLKGQVLTCLLFVALAVVITAALHPDPTFSKWQVGLLLGTQLTAGAVFAALCSLGAAIALKIPRLRRAVPVPDALRSIDLSGARPWLIGFCAGIGEELLFRAALQPLLGLWLGAVIFAAAHARTAAVGSTSSWKRGAYLLHVGIAGVFLGLVFEHLGLIAAILVHATVDVTGLLFYRSLSVGRAAQSAA